MSSVFTPSFFNQLSEEAEVRKAPKLVHYTIVPIKDIAEYKVAAALSEVKYQANKEVKWTKVRSKAIKMVEDQVSKLELTESERAEVAVLTGRRNAVTTICRDLYGGIELIEEPKLTINQQLKQAVKRLWLSAFPQ